MNENLRIQKSFLVQKATTNENEIEGFASAMGVMDRTYDVIFPGAFKDALTSFLQEGFVSLNHDWSTYIAMPKEARESGNKLYTKAVFHSTDDAQNVRKKCEERIMNGLSVGLSVGFAIHPDERKWFDNGNDLLIYARGLGHDTSTWDEAAILGCDHMCRGIMKAKELYEYAIAPIPANRGAYATSVKDFSEADLRSLPYEEHTQQTLTVLREYIERGLQYRATREDKSLELSPARRAEFETLSEELKRLLMVEEPAVEEPTGKSFAQLDLETKTKALKLREYQLRSQS